eukprot:COSAG02_NODE_4565_length_5213_cov_3.488268_8_plen_60_part_01
MCASRCVPSRYVPCRSPDYSVKWWGKNDLLAPDAFNRSVTSAMSMGGPDNGPNKYNLATE